MLALRQTKPLPGAKFAPVGFWLDDAGALQTGASDDARAMLQWCSDKGLAGAAALPPSSLDLVELYAPMLLNSPERAFVVAHLGQSVDSRIATIDGDSYYVTGRENLIHLHRMRALSDAIIVGAATVMADNPRLTTRLVEGPNPTRVLLDPSARIAGSRHVFDTDQAPTLVIHAQDRTPAAPHPTANPPGPIDRVAIQSSTDGPGLDLSAVLATLRARGMHTVFIEGGGFTVTQWLNAGLLDRLHIAIAPVLVGDGMPALQLPAAASMRAARRPPAKLYQMGDDVMWDFDLRA